MELLLIVSLCLTSSLITADNGAVKITVEKDDDVVLPCSPSSKEDLGTKRFEWKKDAKEVFTFDAGLYSGRDFKDQDKQFKDRVSFFEDDLENGNASIKINETKLSDSGTYTCDFPNFQPRQTFRVQLVVECTLKDRQKTEPGACPKPRVTSLQATRDWSLLQCEVNKASPEPVVQWRDSSGNILTAEEPQVTETGGRYNVILQIKVTKSDKYSCVVTQNKICHQVNETTSVYVHGSDSSTGSNTPTWILIGFVIVLVNVIGF